MLIACGIRTMIHRGDPFGEHSEGFFEYPELLVPCRDVPVTEFGMEHDFLLRPPDVEGLVGLVPLVSEEGLFLLRFYEGGVAIQRRFHLTMVLLNGCHKIPIYLYESLQALVRCRDESLSCLTFPFLMRIMEGFEVPE